MFLGLWEHEVRNNPRHHDIVFSKKQAAGKAACFLSGCSACILI